MGKINGSSVTLMVNPSSTDTKLAFAHTQNASIGFSNELVEATLGRTNSWTEFVVGKKNTQISFEGLIDYGTITNNYNIEDLADFLIDSDLLYFSYGPIEDCICGEGYISEITMTGPSDDAASYSGTLVATRVVHTVIDGTQEKLQDSDGNDITDDFGEPIYVKLI